jgi:two-component system, LytTR family, response regulator
LRAEGTPRFRVLVVDDEPLARSNLSVLLRGDPEIEIVGECGSGQEGLEQIRSQKPDLVFLDVQMPELDGFDVVQAVGADAMPATVFVTAYDEYAVRAFEVHALDYLLKPVDADHIARAVERVLKSRAASDAHDDRRLRALLEQFTSERRYLRRLPVPADGRLIIVRAEEIDWISTADNYVTLHVGRREFLLRRSLTWLERELDPNEFVRIHRSTVVRVDRLRELVSESHGDCTARLANGTTLAVSRNFRNRLDQALCRSAKKSG